MKKGFTLIEMLVVVLIIGILSAVALPQYNKAVTKSRLSEVFVTLRSLGEAVQACELENGAGRNNCSFENLSIEMPGYDPDDGDYYYTDRSIYQLYGTKDTPDILAVGNFRVSGSEDVCICIHRDGHFTGTPGDCNREPSWDILKALNIEKNPSECWCC